MLGVDECGDPAPFLSLRDRLEGQSGLARSLWAVDFHNPAAWKPPDAQGDVQRDRSGGDHLDRRAGLVAKPHDGASAELPLDLGEGGFQGLVPVAGFPARPVDACHEYSHWIRGFLSAPTLRAATDKTLPRGEHIEIAPRPPWRLATQVLTLGEQLFDQG